jgi:hypothetical protein
LKLTSNPRPGTSSGSLAMNFEISPGELEFLQSREKLLPQIGAPYLYLVGGFNHLEKWEG